MQAEITWNGSAMTMRVGKVLFKKNKARRIRDPKLIEYCQNTVGFSVNVEAAKGKAKEPTISA